MEQSDWCMHNSVPDDTPPAPPASMPQPLWGSTYFLTPAAAEAYPRRASIATSCRVVGACRLAVVYTWRGRIARFAL